VLLEHVLLLVGAAVEHTAVDLDAQHVADVDAGAGQVRLHGALLVDRAVQQHRRLGPDESVQLVVFPLHLDARHRLVAALILGRAAPR
jgi:hypothetical protein